MNMECIEEKPMANKKKEPKIKPGVCIPWEEKVKELPKILGDEELLKKIWEDNEGLAYMYIWHCLVSF